MNTYERLKSELKNIEEALIKYGLSSKEKATLNKIQEEVKKLVQTGTNPIHFNINTLNNIKNGLKELESISRKYALSAREKEILKSVNEKVDSLVKIRRNFLFEPNSYTPKHLKKEENNSYEKRTYERLKSELDEMEEANKKNQLSAKEKEDLIKLRAELGKAAPKHFKEEKSKGKHFKEEKPKGKHFNDSGEVKGKHFKPSKHFKEEKLKYVVLKQNDTIYIISDMLDLKDLVSVKSDLLDKYRKDQSVSKKFCTKSTDLNGIRVNIKDDGEIFIEGNVDEIEFHNQKNNLNNNFNIIFKLIEKEEYLKVYYLMDSYGAGNIWKKIEYGLDNNIIDIEKYYNLIDFIADRIDIKDNKIFKNPEYQKLIKKYPPKEIDKEINKVDPVKLKKPKKEINVVEPIKLKKPEKEENIGVIDEDNIVHDKIPSSAKKITKRKKAKKSLLQKFKDLKTWQKAAIVAGAVVVVGGIVVLAPMAIDSLNHLLSGNVQMPVDSSAAIQSAPAEIPSSVDFSAIGDGHQVFTNAYDAVSGSNSLVANEFFQGNPVDVFNTATNEFMHLTREQLNNVEFLKELAKDSNNAILLGNSIQDPSGYVSLADVFGEVVKGGVHL